LLTSSFSITARYRLDSVRDDRILAFPLTDPDVDDVEAGAAAGNGGGVEEPEEWGMEMKVDDEA